jgi:hypothetical protein
MYPSIKGSAVAARQGHLKERKMKDGNWYGMHQRDNRIWLKRMMKHFGVTRKRIAEAIGVNISTVDRWLVPPNKSSHRRMPITARKSLNMAIDAGVFDNKG